MNTASPHPSGDTVSPINPARAKDLARIVLMDYIASLKEGAVVNHPALYGRSIHELREIHTAALEMANVVVDALAEDSLYIAVNVDNTPSECP